jgi:hypothetical protein
MLLRTTEIIPNRKGQNQLGPRRPGRLAMSRFRLVPGRTLGPRVQRCNSRLGYFFFAGSLPGRLAMSRL